MSAITRWRSTRRPPTSPRPSPGVGTTRTGSTTPSWSARRCSTTRGTSTSPVRMASASSAGTASSFGTTPPRRTRWRTAFPSWTAWSSARPCPDPSLPWTCEPARRGGPRGSRSGTLPTRGIPRRTTASSLPVWIRETGAAPRGCSAWRRKAAGGSGSTSRPSSSGTSCRSSRTTSPSSSWTSTGACSGTACTTGRCSGRPSRPRCPLTRSQMVGS
mmetsp:Transcript_139103/g.432793  ORF Transcript_139103/g.432793 Transcript_139103/m.432793 type:complete len:216 (+) Transcript_139103:187-834(+)